MAVPPDGRAAPRALRAHMALCLLGFRGSGYSPGFVARMRAVQDDLRARPGQALALVDAPDEICAACPNLRPEPSSAAAGCTLGGPRHEEHMRFHDREVLRRLELHPGEPITWAGLLERIGRQIRGADLPAICTTCPWLPLGVCASSVDALRAGAPEAPS